MAAFGGSISTLMCGSDFSASGACKLTSHHCSSMPSIRNSLSSENYPGKNPKSTINKLESLLYPDKVVAEEKIERPVGLPTMGRVILNEPRCNECETKGLVVCATCTGSGLYIDSIMECQGIIVKVRCLGCGGSGNILCSTCGGRGHL